MHATQTDTKPSLPEAHTPAQATTDTQSDHPPKDHINELKAQLRHAQKLACLGTNAAMLAHEYNNVFAPVISYAHYALENDDVPLMRKALQTMLRRHETVQAMSDRILGLARTKAPKIEQINLRQLLQDAIGCVGRDLAKDNITLTLQADESISVRGDRDALQQVFLNLVLNARQALLGRKGLLKITAAPLPNSMAMIHVRDNGCGIAQDNLQKIFDPFFSTKQNEARTERMGTGLGLAICKDIIEEHAGSIQVESIEGHGTTFTLTLPAVS